MNKRDGYKMQALAVVVGIAAALMLVIWMAGCNGGSSPTGATVPTVPQAQPADWLLEFNSVDVGIESLLPPLLWVHTDLTIQDRNGGAYTVNFIRFTVTVDDDPSYRQVKERGSDDIVEHFGTNKFKAATELPVTWTLTLWPADSGVQFTVTVGVTDSLGNSKNLEVKRVGDTATLRALMQQF